MSTIRWISEVKLNERKKSGEYSVQEGSPNSFVTRFASYSCHDLYLNTPHSTFGKRLLKYKGSVLWNNLPENSNSLKTQLHLRNYLGVC